MARVESELQGNVKVDDSKPSVEEGPTESTIGTKSGILSDPKSFADIFTKSANESESNPEEFQKQLSILKEKLNSPELSDQQKMQTVVDITLNPANTGKFAVDVYRKFEGEIADVDIVTPSGRYDLVDGPDGELCDQMQSVMDVSLQVASLTLDQLIAKDPSKADEIYTSRANGLASPTGAFADVLTQPEVGQMYLENLKKATANMPENLRNAAFEFAELIQGSLSSTAPPNMAKLISEIERSTIRPTNPQQTANALLATTEGSYVLTKEQAEERQKLQSLLEKIDGPGKQAYVKIVNELRN